LNNSSKSWTLKDYINIWSYTNPEYKKLMSFYNTYDFEISQVASLLMYQKIDKTNGGCDSMSRIIKRGMFTITNEKEAVKN